MGSTRVIYSDSTTAECGVVLKHLNFEEDQKSGCWLSVDDSAVKIYIAWGKAPYYPQLFQNLSFTPRIQVLFKTKQDLDLIEPLAQKVAGMLKNLDPKTNIRLFDPDSGREIIS